MADGKIQFTGKVGKERTIEEGYQSARLCVLNCLGVVKSLAGSLDRVKRVVKVNGFVASADGFTDQPKVINGASELLVELFGEAGKHARAAIGVNELPLGSTTEVEIIVEIE